jgi:hypothetical protein
VFEPLTRNERQELTNVLWDAVMDLDRAYGAGPGEDISQEMLDLSADLVRCRIPQHTSVRCPDCGYTLADRAYLYAHNG